MTFPIIGALGLLNAGCKAGIQPPRRVEIPIEHLQFSKAEVAVSPGDTVVWTNLDVAPHTVTADSEPWTSPELKKGATYVVVRGDTGRIAYHCTYHPGMRAVLVFRTPRG